MDQSMIPVRDMHGCAIFRNHLSPPHMHINGGHDIQGESRNKETSRTIKWACVYGLTLFLLAIK